MFSFHDNWTYFTPLAPLNADDVGSDIVVGAPASHPYHHVISRGSYPYFGKLKNLKSYDQKKPWLELMVIEVRFSIIQAWQAFILQTWLLTFRLFYLLNSMNLLGDRIPQANWIQWPIGNRLRIKFVSYPQKTNFIRYGTPQKLFLNTFWTWKPRVWYYGPKVVTVAKLSPQANAHARCLSIAKMIFEVIKIEKINVTRKPGLNVWFLLGSSIASNLRLTTLKYVELWRLLSTKTSLFRARLFRSGNQS